MSRLISNRRKSKPPHIGCCLLLFASLLLTDAAEVKWGESFRESYLSPANGKRISFSIRLPPRIDLEKYPLVVGLKGSLRVAPSRALPFIEVRPSQGNVWGYRAISAFDAMQVIAHMKAHYPIDEDRVYLIGSSAGGSGAMHLASQYPDQFAAVVPLVAAGNNYPVENFLNLPVVFHHGARDWTSAICDARVQYQKMRDFGCSTWLIEYESAGHSIPRPHEPLMKWLLEQRRNPKPLRVTHVCETPALGKSYWLKIDEFIDPHQPASIEAVVEKGKIVVSSTNVSAYSFHDPPVGQSQGSPKLAESAYHAGASANLFQGAPLVVVYGTASGDANRIAQLWEAAHQISACGGPDYGVLRSRFPVIADAELTARQRESCHLILVGTPADNRMSSAAWSRLNAGQFNHRIVSVLRPGQEHRHRFRYFVMPFLNEGLDVFAKNARKYLIGANGFDRASQGDFVVMDLQRRICRQRQFGKDWEWQAVTTEETPLPEGFNRSRFALAHMQVMRKQSGADFALWWGPKDQGMWGADFNFLKRYHPDECTRADLAIERRLVETMLGSVTGAELQAIVKRWVMSAELLTYPKIPEIDATRTYRLHLPMDLYIKLGQRRKNLRDPKPGPAIRTQEAVAELFRQ